MMDKVFCVILDYCGGSRTDKLFLKLSKWNPNFKIHILDNDSPSNKSNYITHQNKFNSGVGGGIVDCISLAKLNNSKYILFIANDILPVTRIDFQHLLEIIECNSDVIQISTSLTKNSDKKYYPWMYNRGNKDNRIVRHADLLCSLLRIDFIDSFGGFPKSRSGWGYDWEISYQAKLQRKKIVVCDYYRVKHLDEKKSTTVWNKKLEEVIEIYNKRYGDYRLIMPFNNY
ncbi:glycosyltransferase family 2 protein [Flagellimonas meridianipacifica]|uniref:GT2 family glycosyltransferase n=1 Tax=Flagellimonas meridianipacifica TaxID=1080225 RepID=A0A2T0MCN4_9FLAO|nr:hypothetical protein [Allomuricauda pacifica]PRX55255.1 GT2 family glycosyltransferase [Allomuricauda pacifica]